MRSAAAGRGEGRRDPRRAAPGGSIYTTDQLILAVDASGIGVFGITHVSGLRPAGGPRTEDWQHVKGAARTIDTAIVPVPAIRDLAPDVRATSSLVAMVREGFDLEEIGRRFYQLFPDDRDFLVVVDATMRVGETASGTAIHVRQNIRGIGASTGPGSSDYGSPDRLQMVVVIARSLFASSPGSGFCLVSHELNHRWAAFTGPPLASARLPHERPRALPRRVPPRRLRPRAPDRRRLRDRRHLTDPRPPVPG